MAVQCKETGIVKPVIDAQRCEGKADCVRVCPEGVFEVRALTRDEKRALGVVARIKVAVHGGKQGFVVRPEACKQCRACVDACPEAAIRLVNAR